MLNVFDRLVRDLLCRFLPLLDVGEEADASCVDPLSKVPSPEYVLLDRFSLLLWAEIEPRPRRLPVRLSLSSRSLGAALISMFNRIAETSEAVMPQIFTYPAAEPYFLFMYSIVLCIVAALEAITPSLVK